LKHKAALIGASVFCVTAFASAQPDGIRETCDATSLVSNALRLTQNSSERVTLSDVVQFVQQQGWRANLGDMCTKFELPRSGDDCIFIQVSLQDEREATSDPRSFNVPAISNAEPQYVLIFHLRPLVGEFFIVSADGILLRAYLRFKGTDYSHVPNEEVQQEFNKNLAYWTTNFCRFKKGLEAERPGYK
jgi:hypothetical protein